VISRTVARSRGSSASGATRNRPAPGVAGSNEFVTLSRFTKNVASPSRSPTAALMAVTRAHRPESARSSSYEAGDGSKL
jgi:hypothetical protein